MFQRERDDGVAALVDALEAGVAHVDRQCFAVGRDQGDSVEHFAQHDASRRFGANLDHRRAGIVVGPFRGFDFDGVDVLGGAGVAVDFDLHGGPFQETSWSGGFFLPKSAGLATAAG